jgi:hypothetical protein
MAALHCTRNDERPHGNLLFADLRNEAGALQGDFRRRELGYMRNSLDA